METFSALLAICAGNSPVPDEFPTQRPVTRSFDAFFDLRLNKQLSIQSRGWWFETLSRSLWRHRNDNKWKNGRYLKFEDDDDDDADDDGDDDADGTDDDSDDDDDDDDDDNDDDDDDDDNMKYNLTSGSPKTERVGGTHAIPCNVKKIIKRTYIS